MLKNLSGLECQVEERIINLTCDYDCPIPHLKEAIFQFSKFVGQIEDAAKAKQAEENKKNETEQVPIEEPKPE